MGTLKWDGGSIYQSYTIVKTSRWKLDVRLNILAELLRFGDREFYKDWWNAKTVEEVVPMS